MYEIQNKPDKEVIMENGSKMKPIATLEDEYGGISHIIIDDHCYVLVNGSSHRPFRMVKHWYREAVEALKILPLPK